MLLGYVGIGQDKVSTMSRETLGLGGCWDSGTVCVGALSECEELCLTGIALLV